eukprot:9198712-Lingulodinium_polyedra.AAC.1
MADLLTESWLHASEMSRNVADFPGEVRAFLQESLLSTCIGEKRNRADTGTLLASTNGHDKRTLGQSIAIV